ncbi:MAG: hypothetical protein KME17_28870 [Cyanosarcina radialis HA8281-LM2]|nr:hypothetical protein [Cyanosarcina radialis HA8281-LM2]
MTRFTPPSSGSKIYLIKVKKQVGTSGETSICLFFTKQTAKCPPRQTSAALCFPIRSGFFLVFITFTYFFRSLNAEIPRSNTLL